SETFTTTTAPKLSGTKVSNEGARVILKIVDKAGRAFNPKAGEIVKRGDRPMFESHVKFNPVITTDTTLSCDFEVAPFPLNKLVDLIGIDWAFLSYSRIPMPFAQIAGQTTNHLNPVVGTRVKKERTHLEEVRLQSVTRINRQICINEGEI